MAIQSEMRRLICDLDLQQSRECPFCFETLSTMELAARHIAVHLIRIALFALPRSTGIEVEQDSRSAVSNENAALSEWTEPEGLNLTASDSMSFDNQSMRAQSRTSSIADYEDYYDQLVSHIKANVINQLETSGIEPKSPEPSEKTRHHTSVAHEVEHRSKQNLSHHAQQDVKETINSAFAHGDPQNLFSPELIAQITEDALNRLKTTVTEPTNPELLEDTPPQSPSREKSPELSGEVHVRNEPRAGEKSLEDFALPVHEGPPPLTDAEKRGIPPTARWTKIARKLVNPEALDTGNERYEERGDYIIVLRVLTYDMIEAYALKTEEIRAKRERPQDSSSHS